ncbi:MAG TPA: hypothetical protein VGH31_06800, partial [Acidimicrobiales bacterium]
VDVQRYSDDPWCGFEVAFNIEELLHLGGPPDESLPKELPILVLNGSEDAVGGFLGGGAALVDVYKEMGIVDATYLGYGSGRHELFNETNRDEVTKDVVEWLNAHTA